MPYVRDNENAGLGGQNPGHYIRSADFVMIMRSSAGNENDLGEVISQIPRFNTDFQHVIIQ